MVIHGYIIEICEECKKDKRCYVGIKDNKGFKFCKECIKKKQGGKDGRNSKLV